MHEQLRAEQSPNSPPLADQYDLFRDALHEASHLENNTRGLKGPLFDSFKTILSETEAQLKELNPTYTPEYLMPSLYQSDTVREYVKRLPDEAREKLWKINKFRTDQTTTLAETLLTTRLARQGIRKGTLDIPPYCQQGDGWNHEMVPSACANACFRMVFGGITGWTPNEAAVAENFIEQTGSPLAEDYKYHNLFETPTFEEISGKAVKVLDIVGADFTMIEEMMTRFRKDTPITQIYAVVSLASDAPLIKAWHTNILLYTTDTHVICHDPSDTLGRSHKKIGRGIFTERWATALNKVQLYLVA